jgi:ATP-dependent DNA helicase DinG
MAQAAQLAGPTRKIYEAVLQTPFDYRTQAVLYTPKHIPLPVSGAPGFAVSPDREKYLNGLTVEIARLLRAADGNAFVLFSATSDLNEVKRRLEDEELKGIKLIEQGSDAQVALDKFMATPRSVILGLKSFWEGVDVVGDKLRLVIITKLPFPMLNDPVLKARERHEKAAAIAAGKSEQEAIGVVFRTIQVPQMVTDLRQGVGRLIRSATDQGVCAILDSRIWTGSSKRAPTSMDTKYAGYGATVVNSLGFATRTSDFKNVAAFLAQIQANAAA